jgi:hypothetical protein
MAQVSMAWCWKKGPSYKVFKHWLIGMEAMQTITGFQGDLLTKADGKYLDEPYISKAAFSGRW